jgi:hypothetical protein
MIENTSADDLFHMPNGTRCGLSRCRSGALFRRQSRQFLNLSAVPFSAVAISYLCNALQPASDQSARIILFQMDIADEAGGAAPAFKHNLSAMKQFEFRTVADADQRRMIRLPNQQLHELVLALRIQCSSRFVENDDVRLLKDNPRECKTLLFTARQCLIPRSLLIQPRDQVLEPDAFESLRHVFRATAVGRFRVVAARRNVPIGMYGRCGRNIILATFGTSIFPSPQGHRPAMARIRVLLPVPESPAMRTRYPLHDRDLGFVDYRGSVVQRYGQLAQRQCRGLSIIIAVDATDALAAFRLFKGIE